jgi:hypothetical protein
LNENRHALSPIGEALAVTALVAVAYLLLRTAPYLAAGAFSDDGVYLALGRALAEGEGYRSVYAVGAPVHLKYPPGLPLLYALLWTVKGDLGFVHAAAVFLSLAATAVTAGVLWWLARNRFRLPAPLAAAFVLGPFLLEGAVQYFNLAISEPWFMLGWAACLLLFPKAIERGWGWALLLGSLAAATTLVRSQAVALIPAFALAAWIRSREVRRPALLLAGGLAPLTAWALWHGARIAAGPLSTQPDEAAYGSWAPDSLGSALRLAIDIARSQALRYWIVLPPHVAPWDWLGAVLWVAVLAAFLIGAVRRFREAPEVVLSVAAVAALVLAWPYSQDRFVLAVLPFVGLLAAAGVRVLATDPAGAGRPRLAPALTAIVGALVVVAAIRQVQIRGLATAERGDSFYFHPAQFLPDNTKFIIAASRWVGAEARPDDRLLTPLSSALWLYTGRKGVNSTPAEPNVGPSVFDVPGRFLATRVLEDDVTLLLIWNPNYRITRDGVAVQQACPQALRFLALTDEPARLAVFRIDRQDPCFVSRFLDPARAAGEGLAGE